MPQQHVSIECHYIDTPNHLHYKWYLPCRSKCIHGFGAFVYLHITARNPPVRVKHKRRGKKDLHLPLEYPLKPDSYNLDQYWIYGHKSREDKVIFDGIFTIRIMHRKKAYFRALINGMLHQYASYFVPDLNSLILHYLFDSAAAYPLNAHKFMIALFKERRKGNKRLIVPSSEVHALRSLLLHVNLVSYET